MPTHLTGRFVLITAVLLGCLFILFPYALFPKEGEARFTPNIRPGIDMVGGSSLLYQIKSNEGAAPEADLAERVIAALRERVDPEGVKNLVWRAQGADKIEIQLPTTEEGQAAQEVRGKFAKAQQGIDDLNVRRLQVESTLQLPAEQRGPALDALAKGSAQRKALFNLLAETKDRLDAVAGKDAAAESEARLKLDALLAQLPNLNVEVAEVEGAVGAPEKATRDARLAALKSRDPIFAGPIDNYVAAFGEFQKVKDAVGSVAELKRLLRGSGVLSFHIAAKAEEVGRENIDRMIERLQKEGPRARPGDDLAWIVNDRPGESGRNTTVATYNNQEYMLVRMSPGNAVRNVEGTPKWSLTSAYSTRDPSGQQLVAFSFDPVGAGLFGEMTGKHRPESPGGPYDLAAVLDNKVISNASINDQISAHGTISGGGRGGFSQEELSYLVRTLSAGSLPAQLEDEPQVERTVGPQLGKDNLRAGYMACVFGVVVVAIFLIGYYYLAGVVAMIAVLLNILLILAGMSALGATFTLPGVAGIILTIGMAVDSNVLIFERLREEQQRGLSLRVAFRNAYDRAFSAILDSNVTAAITGVILYAIGTEDVKGFGLTLLLGIIASLFTALFVTKTIFAFLVDRMGVERLGSVPLSLPWWDRALKPNIDWMGKRWIFLGASMVFIVIGMTLFTWKLQQGRVLDIEFAGGTIVQFNLQNPMPQDEVRKLISEEEEKAKGRLDAPAVQSVGDSVKTADGKEGYKTYEVVTVTADSVAVRSALSEALADKLDVAQAATFTGYGQPLDQAGEGVVIPIEPSAREIAGFVPQSLANHAGGVAIVIRNLQPFLEPADVRARLDQQRVSSAGGATFSKYDVEALPDRSGLIVLGSNPNVIYEADDVGAVQDWQLNVAKPAWTAVNDAIGRPAEFSRVSAINPTIASETATNAIIALITSVSLIVIYVWIRFGDLKYGSATVVALVHDVLITLAALGFAHVLSESFIGNALMLEPFRINLTMVSAILTIIGFSMSDTVVVFDRVRENRQKVGHVDRQVVNDAINQTLSRTLLTGGTTIVTLLLMYITGGPAIHGFTFALLVGLVTGTYSSIAIASPVLLIGTGPKAPALSGEVIDAKAVPA